MNTRHGNSGAELRGRAQRRGAAAWWLNSRRWPVDDEGVLPQLATRSGVAPAAPAPAPADLERLRVVLGSHGEGAALLESLRKELRREYERGYHEGWASTKRPPRSHPVEDMMSRRRRRWRRAWRNLTAATIFRKAVQLVLVMAVSALAAVAGLHLADASHDSRFERPPANPK
jgi:hypothetical protein